MAESVREFLDRRERELLAELVPAEAQVDAIRAELIEIRSARTGIFDVRQKVISGTAVEVLEGEVPVSDVEQVVPPEPSPLDDTFKAIAEFARPFQADAHRTIKQLIIMALEQNVPFRRYGATTGELRRYIKDEYDKVYEVTSLSPQLSRLKDEGAVEFRDGKWKRTEPKKSLKEEYSRNLGLDAPKK